MASPKLKDFKSLREIKLTQLEDKLEKFLNADWVQGKTVTQLGNEPDSVIIRHYYNAKNKSRQLTLRIGCNIIKKLGWEVLDTISLFHDNDNLNLLMFVRHPSGVTLKSATTKVHVPTIHSCNLTVNSNFLPYGSFKLNKVDFLINKDRLFIELKDIEEE